MSTPDLSPAALRKLAEYASSRTAFMDYDGARKVWEVLTAIADRDEAAARDERTATPLTLTVGDIVYRTGRLALDALEVRIEPSRVTLKDAAGATLAVIPIPPDWCPEAAPAAAPVGERMVDAMLARMRANGWTVAVHNDYRQADAPMTFWLFTKGDWCVKGEGQTDAEALREALDEAARVTPLDNRDGGPTGTDK